MVLLLLLAARPVRAEMTPEKLAHDVRQAIAEKTVELQEPKIGAGEGELGYLTFGGIGRAEGEYRPDEEQQGHFYPGKPLAVPMDTQFRIEALRRFMKKDKHKTFTEEHLKELGKLVEGELALINKHTGKEEELMDRLCALDRKAYLLLVGALKARAKREGLRYVGRLFGAARNFTVEIKNLPAGAAVGYLRVIEYEDGNDLNKPENWWSVSDSVELPVGHYMFRAFLAGGKTSTKKVDVDRDRPVSFADAGR
ncbi:MAG TPA: hypothetical protein VJ739_18895 [Gemmataceae bacterium]|nr:hypothetical protein [Gemmataceae bacterium]